jgi:hypothetical protein
MNSKERRKDKRRYRYQVRYNRHIDQPEYDVMWDWCVAQWGNRTFGPWREKHGHAGTFWQFDNEQSYMLFTLRFGPSDVIDNEGWVDYD